MRKISLVLIFAILLSGIGGFGFKPAPAEAATKAVEIRSGVINEWEAECDALTLYNGYTITEDEAASGGKAIYVTTEVPFTSSWPKGSSAGASYKINVLEEGIYYFWIRANPRDTGADSGFIFFDDAPPSMSEYMHWGEYKWYMCSSEFLSVGEHTINFLHRERLLKYDKFILTTVPDFNPAGEKYSTPEFLPEYGETANYYFPLPAVTPPTNEHPRVLLRRGDIERIRNNLTHPQNIATYQALLADAERELTGEFPAMTASQYTNVLGADLNCGEANAFLYLMTGDVEKGKKACNIAVNAMRTMANRKGNDTVTRVGGDTIFVVAKIYDWCYDVMTDEQRDTIRAYMYMHISLMEVGYPTIEQGEMNTHAQEGQLWVDLLCAGIAMYDEDPKLYNMVAGRVLTRMLPIKNSMYDTPFHMEGANYGPFRYSYEILSAVIFDVLGHSNLFNPNIQYQRYGDFWLRRPDGRYFKTGDDGLEDSYGFMNSYYNGMLYSANYFKDPYLKREAFRTNTSIVYKGSGQQVTTHAMYLILNDVDVPVNATFRDFGLTIFGGEPANRMVARTSWDEGLKSDTLIVNMNVVGKQHGGHQHLDAGHFDIYYKGNLAIDSGIYESAPWSKNGVPVASLAHSSEHDFNYHKASVAHNCLLVYDPNETTENPYIQVLDGGQISPDGKGYKAKDYNFALNDSNAGDVISYDYGPDIATPAYSYLKGDITDAYTDKIKEYTRTFMFLNFFDDVYPGALIVLDNVTSSDPSFKKTWLLHSQEKPTVEGKETTIRRTEFGNNGRLINTTVLPEKNTITLVGGEGQEFLTNGVHFNAVPKSAIQEAGKWRIELSPENASERDIFLNVMQMSENDDEIIPLDVLHIDEYKNYAGIEIKDRVVFLRTDSKIGSKDIKVKSASKEGKFMFIVDGLKEGIWNVYDKKGNKVASANAYKGNNTISFKAEAGEYRLSWKYTNDIIKDFTNYDKVIDENPYEVKIDYMYETFKNSYNANDNVYTDIQEFFYKLDRTYTADANIITIGESAKINLDTKTVTKEDGSSFVIESLSNKDGVYYASLEDLAKVIGVDYSYNNVTHIAFLRDPENSIDKFMMINSDAPDRIRVKKAVGCPETTESPYNALDNNTGSYWAAPGKGMWIQFEFEQPELLTKISLKWLHGHTRKETFELFVSEDGVNYELIFKGDSHGSTEDFESYNVTSGKKYKFVKIVGYENSTNNWNSLAEIHFYKPVN